MLAVEDVSTADHVIITGAADPEVAAKIENVTDGCVNVVTLLGGQVVGASRPV